MKANMIKPMTKSTNAFKPLTLAIALAIGVTATNALAEDAMEAVNSNAANSKSVQDTYNNANWQTPLAIEFTSLDTSGNPANAAFNLSRVRGQSSPSSGSAWISRQMARSCKTSKHGCGR